MAHQDIANAIAASASPTPPHYLVTYVYTSADSRDPDGDDAGHWAPVLGMGMVTKSMMAVEDTTEYTDCGGLRVAIVQQFEAGLINVRLLDKELPILLSLGSEYSEAWIITGITPVTHEMKKRKWEGHPVRRPRGRPWWVL